MTLSDEGRRAIQRIFGSLTDAHNQPLNQRFNEARLNDRKIDELIGLCKGVIADGHVAQAEAEFLRQWLLVNQEVADQWPANVLFARIYDMLKDQYLDPDEQDEIMDLLQQITGGNTLTAIANPSPTMLPLCEPPPAIIYTGRIFCFTGKFVTGSRTRVEQLTMALGGTTKSAPTLDTNYLVIGSVGSTDWVHSTHGRKIEKAVDLKANGYPIFIVSEEHWAKELF